METNQIYQIVNSLAQQSMGEIPLTVVDTSSLVSLGNYILSSTTSTESFLNTLFMEKMMTINDFRPYTNSFSLMSYDATEYGRWVQKVKVEMPDAIESPVYNLVDGTSVDQWTIYKPKATQKIFAKRTPYVFPLTTSRQGLKDAFRNEGAMNAFLNQTFGEVRNMQELTYENLARIALANRIALTGAENTVNLVTEYNTAMGLEDPNKITPQNALFHRDFLIYAWRRIKTLGIKMRTMSKQYNEQDVARHTPFSMQDMAIWVDLMQAVEATVSPAAFHDEYFRLNNVIEVPFWQDGQHVSETSIDVNAENTTGTSEIKKDNVVAILYDRDGMGTFRREEDVLTTPVNAYGRYYNTFWHEEQVWFNDLGENAIVFTLN